MILPKMRRVALLLSLMATRTIAQTAGCIGSTNELVVEESKVTDLSVTREYVLCEDTVYSIGFQDYYSSKDLQGGSDMLQLRPNLHLKCGATGSKSNNCLITSGDVQMEGTTFYGAPGDVLENVVITGLTFADAGKHMVWINKPGDILFQDCEFRENTEALSPVFLDYFDAASSTSTLTVTFRRCDFVDNTYYGLPSQPALIVGNSLQNHLEFYDCNFERNDMTFNNTMADHNSFLVETSGPLKLIGNCFSDNAIGVSPIAVHGASLDASSNYQSNSNGPRCALAANFITPSSYYNFSPQCTDFDVFECAISDTSAPIESPTVSPAEQQTPSPASFVAAGVPQPTLEPESPSTAGSPPGSPQAPVDQSSAHQSAAMAVLGWAAFVAACFF